MANPFDEPPKDYGSVTGQGTRFKPSRDGEFAKLRQRVSDACYEISTQTNRLRKLSKQIGTSHDDQELRDEINQVRHTAFQLVETTAGLFGTVLESYSQTADRGQEIAISNMRQSFDKSAKEFGRVYEEIVNKLSAHPRPTITSSMTMEQQQQEENNYYQTHESARLIQEQDNINISFTEQRARQMEDLHGDIVQLHDIMGSIQRMVAEDGEQIDAIETHVERAAVEVGEGRSQLGKAVRYKRCSRRLTVVIVVVVLVIILSIILVSVILACGVGHVCNSKK